MSQRVAATAHVGCDAVECNNNGYANRERPAAAKSVKRIQTLLESSHVENKITAAEEFQQLAKKDVASALGAGVLQQLVAMLTSTEQTARAAAAAGIAVMCTSCDGRDAARRNGVLRPLITLLDQQHKDPVGNDVEHAAKAIMNAAACDLSKRTIHKAGGIPTLLNVIRSGSQVGVGPFGGPPRGAPCPAAVHAAGALMNMVLVKKIRETLAQLNANALLEAVAAQHGSNTLGIRARQAATFMQMQFTADNFHADPESTHPTTTAAEADTTPCNVAMATSSTEALLIQQRMVSTAQAEYSCTSVSTELAAAVAADGSTTSSIGTTALAAPEEPHPLGAGFIAAFRAATAGVIPTRPDPWRQNSSSKRKAAAGKAAAAGAKDSAGCIHDKISSGNSVARAEVSKGSRAGKSAVTFAVDAVEGTEEKEAGDWRV